jgi:hypothetical protein
MTFTTFALPSDGGDAAEPPAVVASLLLHPKALAPSSAMQPRHERTARAYRRFIR